MSQPAPAGEQRQRGAPGAQLALLTALTLLGAALRLYRLDGQSLWFDETFAIATASQPFGSIVANVEPAHPPLYFLLLHAWMLLAGQSALAARALSAASGALLVPISYALGRRLLGRAVGYTAAVLAAVSPLYVYYSQETRMYILVAVAGGLSTYLLVRGLAGGWRPWALYALVAAALLYTHYYGLMLVGAQGLYVVVWLALEARRVGLARLRPVALPWAAAQVAVGALFLPWALYRAWVYGGYVSAASGALSLARMVQNTLIVFTTGNSVEAANAVPGEANYYEDHRLAIALALGYLAIAAVGYIGLLLRPCAAKAGRARPALLIGLLLVAPVLVVYATSIGRREYSPSYLISLALPFLLLVASGLDLLRRRRALAGAVAAAFVLGASLYSLGNYYFVGRYSRWDFRGAAAYLAERSRPGEVLICNAPYTAVALDYYRPGREPCVPLPTDHPLDRPATEARLAEILAQRRFIWLVLWQDYYSDPDQVIRKWLDGHALAVEGHDVHRGIQLRGYLTAPPLVAAEAVPNRLSRPLGDRIALVGYDFDPPVAGQEARLRLYWQALAPMGVDYTVFVHLLGPAGDKLAQDDSQPVRGSYPTSRWQPGQIVLDEHPLQIPALGSPVEWRLEVGVYELATLRRLAGPDGDHIELGGGRIAPGPGSGPG